MSYTMPCLFGNENGGIQGVFAAARDVTDRKKAEEQLRSASVYARSLLEASLDPLVTINADGKITDVNRATEQATGCTREELIGSDFSEYFTQPEEDGKATSKSSQKVSLRLPGLPLNIKQAK